MSRAEPVRSRRGRLVLEEGVRRGTVFPLVLRETLVGRIDSAQLVLDDSSVSRLHARLVVRPEAVYVEDLESREGTWVNGMAVVRRRLEDGDCIAFGDVVVRFHLG